MEDGLGGLLFGASSDSFVVRYSVDDIGLWDPCDVSKFCTTSSVFCVLYLHIYHMTCKGSE